MIYKTQDEKEIFKSLLPEIDEIKNVFKDSKYSGMEIERDIVDCINNEIHHICQEDNKYHKRIVNDNYKVYLRKINDDIFTKKIEKIMDKIVTKLDRLEKEYFERV